MDPLNLILLIVVAIIGWRLRSVLGTRHDDEQPGGRRDAYRLNRDAFENKEASDATPALRAMDMARDPEPPEAGDRVAADAGDGADAPTNNAQTEIAGRGLAYLMDVQPDFDEAGFLDGAGRAYEMTLTAFADGDLSPVRGFLSDEVAAGFEAAIGERESRQERLVTDILRLDNPAIDDAVVENGVVQLDVRFRAELVSFTCAAGTEPDEAARPAPSTIHDVWRFERPLAADGPAWTLIATHAG